MGWKKIANTAEYGGSNGWGNLVKIVPNCTHEEARRIAFKDPKITYFFFCRGAMVLSNPTRTFQPNDAVFFTGEPHPGSSPQCDLYIKEGIAVAYINPPEGKNTFEDIPSTVDVVCIYSGNYVTNENPMLRANNDPIANEPLNGNILATLQSNSVKHLQDKGITVLLTILNGHTEVGWSEFDPNNTCPAQDFVNYLKSDIVDKYGLDGIDIDDEYSNGVPFDQSLAMVSTLFKKTMPDKLLTKLLWNDYLYFEANWHGHTLAENLDYGWEMSYYGGGPESRLHPYVKFGLPKNVLCLGFSAEPRFKDYFDTIESTMKIVKDEGYAGGMLFGYSINPKLMDPIIQATS